MSTGTRERMLQSTAVLLREHGLSGTSVRDVIEHSGAPRGSIYHHFPGGKTQMVEEAVAMAGGHLTVGIATLIESEEPKNVIRSFIELWKLALVESDFRAGCPVVAAAAESTDDRASSTRLASAADGVFRSWHELLVKHLRAHGVQPERASSVATLSIASVEGAVLLCRAQRSVAPIDDVGAELEVLIASLVAEQ